MNRMRRDLDHSKADIEEAMLDFFDALQVPRSDRPELWDFIEEKLLIKEIDFLADRADGMSAKEQWNFRLYLRTIATWRNKWGGEMSTPAPVVGHALSLASIIIPIVAKFVSNDGFANTDAVNQWLTISMMNMSSCRVRRMPNDEISERDVPLIRGELMTHIIIKELDITPIPGAYDNEFYAWLGIHADDVSSLYGEIKNRKSFDPEFIREMVSRTSRPIAEGVL